MDRELYGAAASGISAPRGDGEPAAKTVDTGGPAFPVHIPAGGGCGPGTNEGMTLRQHYAGLALQGMLAAGVTIDIDTSIPGFTRAQTAVMLADALIAAEKAR